MRNTSVLFCLFGIMFLMIGFVGFMAHTFSSSTAELNGIRLVKPSDAERALESESKVCYVSQVFADDFIEMPDNRQKVIKGSICLYALWPDGSKSIIQNWSKEARFIRISESDSLPGEAVVPQELECVSDTLEAAQKLKVTRSQNSVTVEYYNSKNKLSGCYSKGQPQIIIERQVLENGAKAAITVSKAESAKGGQGSISVLKVMPYEKAMSREGGLSIAKTVYLIIGIIGALMFFVPESKAINTITNKMMGGNRLSK